MDTVNKQTSITNRTEIVKIPNWHEADQLEELNSGHKTKNKHKFMQTQGGGFEPGTYGFQVQRPNQ